MTDTLGTNTTGYSYPGATYWRKGVFTVQDMALWSITRDSLVLSQLIGKEGSRKPFITKSELKTKKGDTITCEMGGKITGLGKWGNNTLEGYEKNLAQYYVDCYINQIRQAWKDDGEMSRQRSKRDLKALAIRSLGEWQAEMVERFLICAMYAKWPPHILGDTSIMGYNINSGQLVPNRNWFCADGANNNPTYSATAATFVTNIQTKEAALTNDEADYFSPNVLEGVASWAKENNIKLADVGGGMEGIIGLIRPSQTAQLRKNSDWFNANIHAMPQGANGNPIFTGKISGDFVGKWGNIYLLESNLIQDGDESYFSDLMDTEKGSSANTVEIDSNAANVVRSLFLGREAGVIAEGVAPHIEQKDNFDYNDKTGVAVSSILGMVRSDFTIDDSTYTSGEVNQGSCVVSTYSPSAQT